MDIADYERDVAEKKLLMKINEADNAIKNDGDWLSLDELKRVSPAIGKSHQFS
jgi:hypothetical protein